MVWIVDRGEFVPAPITRPGKVWQLDYFGWHIKHFIYFRVKLKIHNTLYILGTEWIMWSECSVSAWSQTWVCVVCGGLLSFWFWEGCLTRVRRLKVKFILENISTYPKGKALFTIIQQITVATGFQLWGSEQIAVYMQFMPKKVQCQHY